MDAPLRIAMWSGPRNVSTALMRAFGSRTDTLVWDEPFYAHYLEETGLPHPGADEVIADNETDPNAVIDRLLGPLPDGKRVFFQKHMAHHLLPTVPRPWLTEVTHAFLIREPREMLASLVKLLPEPRLLDTGLPQQLALFEDQSTRAGRHPPVIDARDLLLDPEGVLGALCEELGLPFDASMLAWESGLRDTDGNWARHWYGSVAATSGFVPYRRRDDALPEELEPLAQDCEELHALLHEHRITAD